MHLQNDSLISEIFLSSSIFRLSTRKLNGMAVKDGACSSNKILSYINTSHLSYPIEYGLGEAVLEDDLIHATEQKITPKLSGLAQPHIIQDQHSFQKDYVLVGLENSVSATLTNLGRILVLKISLTLLDQSGPLKMNINLIN